MKTSEFKHLRFPFAEFNKPQAEALAFAEQDCNLIAALNTSTGKTAIAMAFFAVDLVKKTNSRCVYTSPLKAISEERVDQFREVEEWRQHELVISTSDYAVPPERFESAQLIIITSEALDSKTRNEKAHGGWLRGVTTLVVDELHMLDEPQRGPALEAGLVNFTRINPTARVVGLSATMSNAQEIARWLKSLNGKPTYVVSSDWRPVPLQVRWSPFYESNRRSYETALVERTHTLLSERKGQKVLVFVHSKRVGRDMTESLQRRGVRCEFYHAGLKKDEKKTLEGLFKSPLSDLNALVTTSALAMGVNL